MSGPNLGNWLRQVKRFQVTMGAGSQLSAELVEAIGDTCP